MLDKHLKMCYYIINKKVSNNKKGEYNNDE